MGKQGPCYHCGVTNTPLWRNGPPEKPVLCNACGSRWRTKGTLVNYTPLHSRADGDESDDHHRFQRMKSISLSYKNKDTKMLKRKAIQVNNIIIKRPALEFNYGLKKAVIEEDASNRSSSGSAVSNSESCAQFSSADGSELTGPSQSNAWDTTVPCKRRTCVGRPKSSSVEKLTKDLYNILQEQQSSCLSVSSEEDLLFENEMSMVSVEIGHGSVLMKNPHSFAREEESEASSLSSIENKSSISEAYSHSVKHVEIGAERGSYYGGKAIKQEQFKRTKSQAERVHVLGRHSSPLCSIDLKDVFNFDEFIKQFTEEEQKKLMKLLPQIDSNILPDSLGMMFESAQFKDNFSLFQQLIADGVFDMSSSSGAKPEDIRTFKKLALTDFNKSRLVESYYLLKEREKETVNSVTTTSKSSNPNVPKNIVTIKRRYEDQTQLKSESRGLMRSPKRVIKMKVSHESKVLTENNVSCFNPRSLASVFAQEGGGSAVFGYEGNCSSDQDLLLLDLPSNGSFPQAELLHQI
ncbi:PREDICTED: GATA transcription factor 26-like isoform X2 [Camelina sativa]|uniref:GATA transcription factor 26-like isoform X2 n=1 Tax=Camelina sativa TaxID=90675 RepID=A0ABM0U1Y8_CAMSA|nr:PREDICTED: GATA transcription factor 26-like isoform X2 [Camelina sativa]